MLLAALALGFPQTPPAAEARVSVRVAASRLADALPALGKAAGVRIEASPAVADEVVLLEIKDLPLNVVLARVADVTAGAWQFDGTVYRLVPDAAKRAAEEREERAARFAAIRQWQERSRRKPAKPDAKKDEEEVDMLSGGAGYAFAELPADVLAGLEAGDRVVFADSPNRSQRPLPAAALAEIRRFVLEHNDRIGKAKIGDKGEEEAMMAQMPEPIRKMILAQTKPIGSPAKAIVAVSRGGSVFGDGTLRARLTLLGSQGEGLFGTSGTIGLQNFLEEMGIGEDGEPKPPAKPPARPNLVQYRAESKAFDKAFPRFGLSGPAEKPGPEIAEVRAKIARPDLFDPLSFGITDRFRSLATVRGKSLVASLPDSLMSAFEGMRGPLKTVEEVEKQVTDGRTVRLVETDGVLVLRPVSPVEARKNRVSRSDLAAVLRIAKERGTVGLNDAAAFALRNPDPSSNGVEMRYLSAFVPGLAMSNPFEASWSALRFWGSLAPTQREILGVGERLPLGGLPSGPTRRLVLGDGARLVAADAPRRDMMTESFEMGLTMSGSGGGADQEPTEVMPLGLPAGGYLNASVTEEPFLASEEATGMFGAATLGPEEIAMVQFFTEDPDMKGMAGAMPKPGPMRMGRRRIIELTFRVGEKTVVRHRLSDLGPLQGAPTVKFDALPADLQKLVAERKAAIKNSPMGALGSLMRMGGKGAVPPP